MDRLSLLYALNFKISHRGRYLTCCYLPALLFPLDSPLNHTPPLCLGSDMINAISHGRAGNHSNKCNGVKSTWLWPVVDVWRGMELKYEILKLIFYSWHSTGNHAVILCMLHPWCFMSLLFWTCTSPERESCGLSGFSSTILTTHRKVFITEMGLIWCRYNSLSDVHASGASSRGC